MIKIVKLARNPDTIAKKPQKSILNVLQLSSKIWWKKVKEITKCPIIITNWISEKAIA